MRRYIASALCVSLAITSCSSETGAAGGATASAGATDGYGELTFPHLGVRIQAPVAIKSVVEEPNKADTTGKTYLSTINLGTTLEPVELRFMNDPIVIPASFDAIKGNPKNAQVEKLPTGAVAYLRGDEPTVWLQMKGMPNVTCSLTTKKDEASVALAWRVCKSLRPNDG